MYCTYCGTQNPDDYRFCYACGKPRAVAGQPAPAPVAGQYQTQPSSEVAFIRNLLLSAADEYERRGADNPFEFVDLDTHWSSIKLLKNLTNEQIAELVWANRFTEAEKRIMDNNPEIYITYLNMVRLIADTLETSNLMQGAFEAKTVVVYNSYLRSLADDKEWQDYDALTSQYLHEARQTKSALFQLRPLVKAAHAKLMLNDRRTCREYLDEFNQLVGIALRERPAYTSMSDETMRQWVQVCQAEASNLRNKL